MLQALGSAIIRGWALIGRGAHVIASVLEVMQKCKLYEFRYTLTKVFLNL